MLAKATDEQKDSLKKYMKKIKDIKLRVPEEYLETCVSFEILKEV